MKKQRESWQYFSRHESRCLIQARQSQYVDLKHAIACPLLPHFSVSYHIFLGLVNKNSFRLPLRWNPFSCGISRARRTAGLRFLRGKLCCSVHRGNICDPAESLLQCKKTFHSAADQSGRGVRPHNRRKVKQEANFSVVRRNPRCYNGNNKMTQISFRRKMYV